MAQIVTVARIYANVLADKAEEYYDCDNFSPEFDDCKNYRVDGEKLGSGKYSNVLKGVHLPTQNIVAFKLLKPIATIRINREIKILQTLLGGVNIISLLAVVDFDDVRATALVFEKVNNVNFTSIYLNLGDYDTRFYIHELLKALDYCHSMGIMHRDVKPHNVMVDPVQRKLKLIDWGLAEFYHPGHEYSVRVCSRYFMAPELLVKYVYYDYSLDMWSLGCIFAAMIYKRQPFFHGSNTTDQLVQTVKVLGTAKLLKYLDKYNIVIETDARESIGIREQKNWSYFKNPENEHLLNADAYAFLEAVLCYDHFERITAKEALQHKYFSKLTYSQQLHVASSLS